jgi:succinate-semialdehyde dehydrogenase/glutarate-semialdehyde dehydrogenase
MVTRKVAPALAAGCTVVLKPNEHTPLTALALAKLAELAGLPAGVLNVVTGLAPKPIGDALLASETVRKFSFTGSTAVGRALAAGAAVTVKRVSLELGGNAPFLVFPDADVERAARDAALSSYRGAGQTCICTNRVLVHESIHDRFVAALVARTAALRVGAGMDKGTTLGPLITPAAVARVATAVDEAVAGGARAAAGGRRPAFDVASPLAGGNFFEPTVLVGAPVDARVFTEETFGPVTPVLPFHDEGEAVRLANDTPAGLAAYVYTAEIGRAFRVAEALDYGMVGINAIAITAANVPFGGVKQSGLGRENGRAGLAEFLELKTVCFHVGAAPGEG